jgi:alpha-beta hydrolase superfamily lysophospholipase
VLALDHRGHGGSQGPAGLGDFGGGDSNALVADLGQFVADTRAQRAGLPLALFGHSMGSFAAQQYCVTHEVPIHADEVTHDIGAWLSEVLGRG